MAQTSVSDELLSIIKVNAKGWNILLFEDGNKISGDLCANCNAVCCDAVELGCDHNDEDIYQYCNNCLQDLINNNCKKCPINGHEEAIIIPTRATRRKITRALVSCPNSWKYKQRKNSQKIHNVQVSDTLANDQKEGHSVVMDNNRNNNNNFIKNENECNWSGSLETLIANHLNDCMMKCNPSYMLKIENKYLKMNNDKLNQIVVDQKQKIKELNVEIDNLKSTNIDNQINIDRLTAMVIRFQEALSEYTRNAAATNNMTTIQNNSSSGNISEPQNGTSSELNESSKSVKSKKKKKKKHKLSTETYNGPPLTMVFDESTGQGLEMSVGFERQNGEPVMIVRCENKTDDAITRIDIKFNKNYLGIQPTNTLPLNGDIGAGETQIINLRLQLSQAVTPKNPLDLTVQMAARSVRTNVAKAPVTMFVAQIPAEIFFDNNNDYTLSGRNEFLSEWREISTEDQSQTIKQCQNTDVSVVKDIFVRNQCSFVAERQIPNRGVSLYFATTLRDIAILLEISIANNGACRVVVKSKNKYLSYVSCQTAVKVLNA